MAPSRALALAQPLRHLTSPPRSLHPRLYDSPPALRSARTYTRNHAATATRPPAPPHTPSPSRRHASSSAATASPLEPPPELSDAERVIFAKLRAAFAPSKLEVQDISGGCGSMYSLEIEAGAFAGLSVVRQQRLVNEVLKDEIGGWHGVRLKTGAPPRGVGEA